MGKRRTEMSNPDVLLTYLDAVSRDPGVVLGF